MKIRTLVQASLIVTCVACAVGCSDGRSAPQKAGDETKGAAEKTGHAVEKAADKTGDAAEKAGDKVHDATH